MRALPEIGGDSGTRRAPAAKRVMATPVGQAPNVCPVDAHPPSSRPILRSAAPCCSSASAASPRRRGAGRRPHPAERRPAGHALGESSATACSTSTAPVRLAGDTSASTPTDVFIGPDASLQTCYDIAHGRQQLRQRAFPRASRPRAASRSRRRSTLRGAVRPEPRRRGAHDPRRAGHARRRRRDGRNPQPPPAGSPIRLDRAPSSRRACHAPGSPPSSCTGPAASSIGGDASSAERRPGRARAAAPSTWRRQAAK